jgi:creatinine amidohydrolase
VLPLAAIEQHGPHLTVETDTRIATILCQATEKSVADYALFLPVLAYGCSAHHMSFPGTLSLKHETWLRIVDDVAGSIFQQGFNTFVLFNAHGGNQAVGQLAIERLGEQYPDKKIAMVTWWKLDSKVLMELNQTGSGGVGHAGEFETSIMLAHAPDSVRQDQIPANRTNCPTHSWAEGDMLRGSEATYFRNVKAMAPNGVYGEPSAATARLGEQITDLVSVRFASILGDLFRH